MEFKKFRYFCWNRENKPFRDFDQPLYLKACFWFWTKVRLACERPIEIDYQMVDEAEVTPLPDSEDEYVCVYESEGELVEKVVTYCWTHQNKCDL